MAHDACGRAWASCRTILMASQLFPIRAAFSMHLVGPIMLLTLGGMDSDRSRWPPKEKIEPQCEATSGDKQMVILLSLVTVCAFVQVWTGEQGLFPITPRTSSDLINTLKLDNGEGPMLGSDPTMALKHSNSEIRIAWRS
ncbi:hypothetical protein VNO77_38870 [Canavalia gladiata]|uniref:Uncharacterized protein n=1 Tax=Canavalia gladiata TaxID=3824 RepID=A0AAN9KA09_CANGL